MPADNQVFSSGDHFDQRIDYASNTVTYIGEASPGSATSASVWRIKRQSKDSSGRTVAIEFAGNAANFNAIWDNRSSLQYGP